MNTSKLMLTACICVALFFAQLLLAADTDAKFQKILAVQKALLEGQDHFKKGNYQAAVFILEAQIASIDGNKEYLQLLHNAYQGHIRDLQAKGLTEEISKYEKRLQILDSGITQGAKSGTVAPVSTPAVVPAPATASVIASALSKFVVPTKVVEQPKTAQDAPKVRGKIEDANEDNPFSFTNTQRYHDARLRLDQAEKEFAGKNFRLASKLYEESYRLEPKVMPQSVERWAYCRLYSVVEAMNQKQNAKLDPQWENEIRVSLSMAPQLQSFGNTLLANIDQRKQEIGATNPLQPSAAVVEVKHTGPYQGNWYLAETKNFRVWHHLNQADATQVAKSSEACRVEAAMKWFGAVGNDWTPICEIYLHPTAQEYSKSTGAPVASPGHTTLKTEGVRVLSRRIDLHTDEANMMTGVLPHETTHVVLAGRMGDQPVPRWADEGMAVLSEPKNRIQKHLDNLPKHARENTLFHVSRLMQMADYPEPKLVGPFYAQSVSLVDYLTRLKGPQAFGEFMKDGLKNGYESALSRHYGIQSYNDLNQSWWNACFSNNTAAKN
ncbi:MAG: hypothetical protein JHC56_08740 [Gemmataceae bacterium]|nr:hypothetical protein [Gemmataceae bacterium]MBJ7431408.1 hypothetical protein [Gemmataceae bacterium]MBJ7494955.1 hypothetical protein [Gemmataceae bacterium]